jgi:hypothetical protein
MNQEGHLQSGVSYELSTCYGAHCVLAILTEAVIPDYVCFRAGVKTNWAMIMVTIMITII